MAKKAVAQSTAQKESLPDIQILPTPPVGWWVHYYPSDQDVGDFVAALVTRIDAPGQVQLEVHGPSRHSFFKSGVNWLGNDRRMAAGRPFRLNGCWDFIPDSQPRNATAFHKDKITARLAATKATLAAKNQAELAVEEAHASRRVYKEEPKQ